MTKNSNTRTALVTGAATGIGRGIALRLAADGCMVALADIQEHLIGVAVEEIRSLNGRAIGIVADISRQDNIDRMILETVEAFGAIDILVNNAGVATAGFIDAVPDSEIDRVFGVNLLGAIKVTRAAAPHLKKSGRGRIINISSVEGIRGSGLLPVYSSTKAGLIGLTRANAVELAGSGVTVNAVCPGAIQTDMLGPFLADEKFKKKMLSGIPMRRLGLPEDVAAAVSFLASEGSGYITGNVMVVDGGMTVKTL
ncbi:MAG TPA: SDR family oxidoreductase [Spirochaetes bacterium]|nr:SDR family oxidoreductase [Spirochaetota bacterium]